jgi:uncharacterized protein YeeX (DUF496 family)
MSKTQIYKRKEKVPWQEIDDQVVIIQPQQQKVHELNEVAAFVWKNLNGTESIEQIIHTLPNEFEDIPSSVNTDIQQLLDVMCQEGLVECL